jgi:hypothetical protein
VALSTHAKQRPTPVLSNSKQHQGAALYVVVPQGFSRGKNSSCRASNRCSDRQSTSPSTWAERPVGIPSSVPLHDRTCRCSQCMATCTPITHQAPAPSILQNLARPANDRTSSLNLPADSQNAIQAGHVSTSCIIITLRERRDTTYAQVHVYRLPLIASACHIRSKANTRRRPICRTGFAMWNLPPSHSGGVFRAERPRYSRRAGCKFPRRTTRLWGTWVYSSLHHAPLLKQMSLW